METSSTRPIKVVVVDDHALFRRGLQMVLEGEPDIEVVGEANDGHELLEHGTSFDVVLMDLCCATLSNIQATRELITTLPATKVLVLVDADVTIELEEEAGTILLDAIRAGAAGCLLKDISIDQVAEAVRQVCRGFLSMSPRTASTIEAELNSKGADLSRLERDLLSAVGDGLTGSQIASQFGIPEGDGRSHLNNVIHRWREVCPLPPERYRRRTATELTSPGTTGGPAVFAPTSAASGLTDHYPDNPSSHEGSASDNASHNTDKEALSSVDPRTPAAVYKGSGKQKLPDEAPVAVWRYQEKGLSGSKVSYGRMEFYESGALYQITDRHGAWEGSPLRERLFDSPEDVEHFITTDKFWRKMRRQIERIDPTSGTPPVEERTPERTSEINQAHYNRWLEEHERGEAQGKRWAVILAIIVGTFIAIAAIQGGGSGVDPGDCLPGAPPSQGGC